MATTQQQPSSDTATRILDVAEELVQRRGFNGFSYADVAAELKITTASLHYHFAGKAELGRALIDALRRALLRGAGRDRSAACRTRRPSCEAYAELYAGVLREKRLCLCGMLAAEYRPCRSRCATP